jgi:hypothetical protein
MIVAVGLVVTLLALAPRRSRRIDNSPLYPPAANIQAPSRA